MLGRILSHCVFVLVCELSEPGLGRKVYLEFWVGKRVLDVLSDDFEKFLVLLEVFVCEDVVGIESNSAFTDRESNHNLFKVFS